MPKYFFLTNLEGKYVYTNKEVSGLCLDIHQEEMVNKTNIADNISPPSKLEEYYKIFKKDIE